MHKQHKIYDKLQFAYKKKVSTNTATLTLKEVLRYYSLRNTAVRGCVLDASKAFDRVRHDKLYQLLYDRGLPPIILRTLIDLYERQVSRCQYGGAKTGYYNITNGVRQEGVASPTLFSIYGHSVHEIVSIRNRHPYWGDGLCR